MTSHSHSPESDDAFLDWIRTVVPAGAIPVGWCHKTIHRHIVDKAPDVVDATKEAISQSFGETPHVVLEIYPDDAALRANGNLAQAFDRTDGGVLLVGVGYERG